MQTPKVLMKTYIFFKKIFFYLRKNIPQAKTKVARRRRCKAFKK
jgi:hypothetical protein